MSSLNIMKLVILIALALALIKPSIAPVPDRKWRVHVVNGLSHSKILYVHCKSGDDDLGIHNLTAGTQLAWKFKVDFFEKTLYWCFLSVRSQRIDASFDVFWADEDLYYKCNYKDCFWTAKDNGIYLRNIPQSYDEFQHKWKHYATAMDLNTEERV